jgi:CheY-like chemotaxis protein
MKDENAPAPFILIAEDNADDQLLLQYAFRAAHLPNKFHIVSNGAEAITWLTSAREHPNNLLFPAPGLVILDIQMPYKSGLQVLEWIRSEPAYGTLPVVIMSGNNLPETVERALKLGAQSYLFKPGDYSELTGFIYDFNILHSLHACEA